MGKKKKNKAAVKLTSIESEIIDMMDEAPKHQSESRLDYLCRLSVAASPDEEESQALSDLTLGWVRAFETAPANLEPKDYIAQVESENKEQAAKPKKDDHVKPKPKPKVDAAPAPEPGHFEDDAKPQVDDDTNVTFEFRKFIIRNYGPALAETIEMFPYHISRRSATTIFYQARGVLEIMLAMELTTLEEMKGESE